MAFRNKTDDEVEHEKEMARLKRRFLMVFEGIGWALLVGVVVFVAQRLGMI